jgi:hypothetical protein
MTSLAYAGRILLVLTLVLGGSMRNVSGQGSEENDLASEVAAVFEGVRRGEGIGLSKLDEYGVNLLPLLSLYVADESWRVRYSVMDLAARVPSAKAAELLAGFLGDKDPNTVERALGILLLEFSCAHLIDAGDGLKQRLLRLLDGDRLRSSEVLLLRCYGGDDAVKESLVRRAASERPTEPGLSLAIGVTLVELGVEAQKPRTIAAIQEAPPRVLAVLLVSTRLIGDRDILGEVVRLLYDEREVYPPELTAGIRMRVCDLALYAVADKTEVDLGVPRGALVLKGMEWKPQSLEKRNRAYDVMRKELERAGVDRAPGP